MIWISPINCRGLRPLGWEYVNKNKTRIYQANVIRISRKSQWVRFYLLRKKCSIVKFLCKNQRDDSRGGSREIARGSHLRLWAPQFVPSGWLKLLAESHQPSYFCLGMAVISHKIVNKGNVLVLFLIVFTMALSMS